MIGITAVLEALPTSEMKLHVIMGRPYYFKEVMAHATEVEAVIKAERSHPREKGM